MKVLLTGGSGQLGHDVARVLAQRDCEVVAPTRRELDLSALDTIDAFTHGLRPDWVINCAAYTAVDAAESEPGLAATVNADAPARLAKAVAQQGGRMLQVSTDFVFAGDADRPYRESDTPGPLSVYGRSKLAGEQAVQSELPGALIVRTAWVYGAHGHNFVKTMLRNAREGKPLRVVNDQAGAPTWTADLAAVIADLIEAEAGGLYHYTNAGSTSWHGFASAILEEALALGYELGTHEAAPIPTSDYPTPARRPAYSVLDTGKIAAELGRTAPPWRDSLKHMLEELQTCDDCW